MAKAQKPAAPKAEAAKKPKGKAPSPEAKKKAEAKKEEPPKVRPLALVIPAKVGVQDDSTSVGWDEGEKRTGQKVDGDGDGEAIDSWLNSNAAKSNTTQQGWLDQAVKNMHAKGEGGGSAEWMKDVPDLKSSGDVKGLLDGLYARFPKGNDAYTDKVWPMWKAAGCGGPP